MLFYAVSAVALTAIAELLAKPLAMIFVSHDAALLDFATRAIRIFSISFIISGFNIYASAFFTALNNGVISAVISISRTLLFQIGAVFLMPLIFGIDGIWSATIIAEFVTLTVSVACVIAWRKKYNYL